MSKPTNYVGYAPGRQRPHEILIIFAAILSGLVGLLSPGSVAPSIAQAFPGDLADVYFTALIIAGSFAMYGALGQSMISPLLERAGLFAMALFVFAYALSLVARNGQIASVAAIMPTAVAIANLIRCWQISQHINEARRDVE